MSEVLAYPLQWPPAFPRTDPANRARARFGKPALGSAHAPLTVADARERLLRQIRLFTRWPASGKPWRIDPGQLVISSNLQVRLDGWPRSGQREPDDPGVAVYFHLDGTPHVLPCDRWDRVADNIAAIAAHLDAMRGMERWGVGDLRAHFAGFKALPHSSDNQVLRWWQVLGCQADAPRDVITAAYRRLRSLHHPDNGGDQDKFNRVQWAFEQSGARS